MSFKETNCNYRLHISEEDFDRAQNDAKFAQSLFLHAKVSHPTVNEEESEGVGWSSPIDNENNRTTTSIGTKQDSLISDQNHITYNADNQNLEDNPEFDSNQDGFGLNERSLEPDDSESKHIWGFNETLCFIDSMESKMEDLAHATKRRQVWQDVANHLNKIGYNVTNVMCHTKWKNLLRSYKSTKDNKAKTDTTKSRFLFFDKMDNLFDKNHIAYNADNQNLGYNLEFDSNEDEFVLNGQSIEPEDSESKHIWGFDETVCFIDSMESKMEDLADTAKRKQVWQNVANDLSSVGYSVTNVMCHNKWKNLLRSYKSTKNNKKTTDTTKSRFLFFDKMGNLLDQNHITCNADNQNLEDNLEFYSNEDVFDLNGESLEPEDSEGKHIWSCDETICLIDSMEIHMEDLAHATKRIHVWQNVANDLNSVGYSVTNVMCHNKWKSLLRSYKSAKDNKTKSGTTKSRFLFFDKMDNLLDKKPTNSCKRSLESSNLGDIGKPEWNNEENDTNTLGSPNRNSKSYGESSTETPIKKRKRDNDLMTLLKLKEEEYKRRQERFMRRMELQERKLQYEERKIALLEKLIPTK